jgi:hypothetical protein
MHIVSQTLFHWSRCLPASELPSAVPDPTQGIAQGLRIEHCSVPKYGDLLQWCDINRDGCASGKRADCAEYQPLCSVSLPDALDIILSIEAERDRANAASDGGTAQTAANDTARRPRGGGCRAGGDGAPRPSPARRASGLWVLLGWLTLLIVRRAHGRSERGADAAVALVPRPRRK